MDKTEHFFEGDKPFATLTETVADGIVTQKWVYEPNAVPFRGAKPGGTRINISLASPDGATAQDIDMLISVWERLATAHGYRAGCGRIDAESFLSQTRGHGCLHVTAC